jgi:hypothetical protein
VSRGFVEVPADAIRQRLAAAGFHLVPEARGEEVYERAHDRDGRYTVRVYSSIQRGAEEACGCGEDAIRVVTLFADARHQWPARAIPIFKATRVHRTGSVEAVLERMVDRAREAYAACNRHRNGVAETQRAIEAKGSEE